MEADTAQTCTESFFRWFVRWIPRELMNLLVNVFHVVAYYARERWLMKDYSYMWRDLFRFIKFPIGRDKKQMVTRHLPIAIPEKWLRAQENLKRKIIFDDTEPWQKLRLSIEEAEEYSVTANSENRPLQYVAGVDLSYMKESDEACAALVVCRLPDMKVVYEDYRMKKITVPYVPGFLSFREVLPFLEAVRTLLIKAPHLKPQVILVDGNGILHPREAGLACHLGVSADIPCVGVAKNLLVVGNIMKDKLQIKAMKHSEKEMYPLVNNEGHVLGMAVKTTSSAMNPVYVSVGHRISLDTAVWVVKLCSLYRVPEPIRQADIRSREFLRDHYPQLKKDLTPKEDHINFNS